MAVPHKRSKVASEAASPRPRPTRATTDPDTQETSVRGPGDAAGPSEGLAFEQLVRNDPELLRSLVDQAADALCLHEIDGRILDVNRRMCTTLGYTREELLSLSVLDIDVHTTPEEAATVAMIMVPGVPLTGERVLRRKDGSTFPIELSLSLIVSGQKRLMLGMARDITDRKRAEQVQEQAQRALEERVRERTQHLGLVNRLLEQEIRERRRSEAALRESEERFRKLAERGHLLAWEANVRTGRFTYVGPQAADLLGYPLSEWYRPGFWVDRIHPDDRQWVLDSRRHYIATAVDYELAYRMMAADGRPVWVQSLVHVIHDDAGPSVLRGFMIDVTARTRAEEARQLLLRELDHRVKNTLSTVQAVAELTLRTSTSLEQFAETFRGRIAALARMHAAIWRSKGTPLGLRDLAELSLAPFGREGERVSIEGTEVPIPLASVGALGLALHELATNAAKHGALSVASGSVRLAWRPDGERLCLTWRESGGPAVVEPTHRGFGSTLIRESIPYELGGAVALDFAPSGVECTITFPLALPRTPSAAPDGEPP
jgi:PAS domain S-box-containing protein